MGLTSDGLYALVVGTAGRWVKRSGRYLRWERYITGGVFIGLGVTAALAGTGASSRFGISAIIARRGGAYLLLRRCRVGGIIIQVTRTSAANAT